MLADFPLLSTIIFLPCVGSCFILLIRGDTEERVDHNARIVALWISLLVFILSVILFFTYDPTNLQYQFVENSTWIADLRVHYHVGVDGLSLFFILLSTFLTPV